VDAMPVGGGRRLKSRLMGVPPGVYLRRRDAGRRRPTWRRNALSPRIHSAAAVRDAGHVCGGESGVEDGRCHSGAVTYGDCPSTLLRASVDAMPVGGGRRLKSRLMGVPPGVYLRRRDAGRRRPAIEIAPHGRSAGRLPAWTRCRSATAGD